MKKKQPKHVQEIYTHPIHEILKKRGHKQSVSLVYFFERSNSSLDLTIYGEHTKNVFVHSVCN